MIRRVLPSTSYLVARAAPTATRTLLAPLLLPKCPLLMGGGVWASRSRYAFCEEDRKKKELERRKREEERIKQEEEEKKEQEEQQQRKESLQGRVDKFMADFW